MKKVFFAFVAVSVMALVSCNSGNQTEATTETVDTTAVVEAPVEVAVDSAAAATTDSAAAATAPAQ